MDWNVFILVLLIFLPLIGGTLAKLLDEKNALIISISSVGLGLILSIINAYSLSTPYYFSWHWAAGISMGFGMDRLSAILILLVYFIALLVYIFSINYMEDDKEKQRYFFMLGFFATSMVGLLASDHLLSFFIFWELVGFSSYLLIGFWYTDSFRAVAAKNTFMINRIADAFLLAGIVFTIVDGYPLGFSSIQDIQINQVSGFCFILGAFGKSAQFPFFGWLTKAMAGPTPVSALIHAATMVTAGVYLLIRLAPSFSAGHMAMLAMGGALTAVMGGVAALTQFDIKKVLAYSTISQLGLMVLGIGVGAYQASLFHLWTHAFFKAGLFLGAGTIIHYMYQLYPDKKLDVQDMRNMGSFYKILPLTFYAFLMCGLALSGLPLLSGFLSKEGILVGSVAYGNATGNYLVPVFAFLAALITPIYIGRQVMLIFIRQGEVVKRIREPLYTVKVPLMVLAIGSLWFWNSVNPINAGGWFWYQYLFAGLDHSSSVAHSNAYVTYGSISLTLIGLGMVLWFYRPKSKRMTGFQQAGEPTDFISALSFRGWYLERFYAILDNTFLWWVTLTGKFDRKVIDSTVNTIGVGGVVLAKITGWFDHFFIDGLVNLIAGISRVIGRGFSNIQAAEVQKQLTWLLLGILGIFLWFQLAL